MKAWSLFLGFAVIFSGVASGAKPPVPAEAPGLSGIVSSEAEGPMEGVLVSAKRVPGTVTTTVVSDAQGRYAFPAGRLEQGKYRLEIRAIGYEPTDPELFATLGTKPTIANISLKKTSDLAAQMSDVEWLMSIPGTYEQKEYLFMTCSHCHTLAPVLQSTYDKAGWMTTFKRMRGWDQVSSINHPVPSPEKGGTPFGNEDFAQFLASINLSARATHDFELKTLPRPHGDDTKVIVTEYDLPRENAEPHDAAPDKSGMIWYQDFAEGIIGRLNPANGEIKEWKDETPTPGVPPGFQAIEWDKDGNMWLGRHDWNNITKFDVKAEKFTNYPLAPEVKADFVSVGGDGKVWAKDTGDDSVYRLDPATGQIKKFDEFPPDLKIKDEKGTRHHIYGITADQAGNLYEADIVGGNLFQLNGETGLVARYPIPTEDAGPRRMHLDGQGRLWIGEYYGKTIGMFDTHSQKFQEWKLPVPWYGAYDVALDKDGFAWTGTMTSEIILRLNLKTGEFRQYMLPRLGVNVRRVEVGTSGGNSVFWVGENHQAKIARVEPLN
ncbi:MAG TPA: carboxypeptidase regulatory-like domain-containing protein [Candidatus Acidoferrales bacterium]|jgi:streptogramin lyase|nr:carboxypeptidase regulatory-like domain-containing protein [Candidatus Acidoferrales bacterium]